MNTITVETSKLEVKIQQEIKIFLKKQVITYEKAKRSEENFESLKNFVNRLPELIAEYFEIKGREFITLENILAFNIIEKFAKHTKEHWPGSKNLTIPTGYTLKTINEKFSSQLFLCVNRNVAAEIARLIRTIKKIDNPIYRMYSDSNFDNRYFWEHLLKSYLKTLSIKGTVQGILNKFYQEETVVSMMEMEFGLDDRHYIVGTLDEIFNDNRLFAQIVDILLDRSSLEKHIRNYQNPDGGPIFEETLVNTLDGFQHIYEYNSDTYTKTKIFGKKRKRNKFNLWFSLAVSVTLSITFSLAVYINVKSYTNKQINQVNDTFDKQLAEIRGILKKLKETTPPSQNEVRSELEKFQKKIEDLDSKVDNLANEALKEDEDVIRKLKELLEKENNENK